MNIRLLIAVLAASVLTSVPALAQGACPLICPANVTDSITGSIPAVAGLTLVIDYDDAVPGKALEDCETCDDCLRAVSITFEWTGAPAARFRLKLTNNTGTSFTGNKFSREGFFINGCLEAPDDFLTIELQDTGTTVYTDDSVLDCGCGTS